MKLNPDHDFLLFAGDVYYPGGGWEDFRGSFPDIETANAIGNHFLRADPTHRWFHVVNIKTGEIEVKPE